MRWAPARSMPIGRANTTACGSRKPGSIPRPPMTRPWLAALLSWNAALTATGNAFAMSPDAAATALAERFAVTVLRVTPIEGDGRQLYAVAVMNPGGNFNEAFKVT